MLFRIVFGLYLIWHFALLLPYGVELFSDAGILSNPQLNLTAPLFPRAVLGFDSPMIVTIVLAFLTLLSIGFTLGIKRRLCALILWAGWMWLFNRNNLIINPSIPYVGLMLVFCSLIPEKELGSKWVFPSIIYSSAWFLMAAGYSYSGYWKLLSPSWQDGTALLHLLNNPLARPGIIRDLLLSLPEIVLKLLTWGVLVAEVACLPLIFHQRTRLFAWISLVLLHIGILFVVDFADLTLGMLLIHLFTFDQRWFQACRPKTGLFLYDAECGMCDHTVAQLARYDQNKVLCFEPLQGPIGVCLCSRHGFPIMRSAVYVRKWLLPGEQAFAGSDAILAAMNDIGGISKGLSILIKIVPKRLRDFAYDWIALRRHHFFPPPSCPLVYQEISAK